MSVQHAGTIIREARIKAGLSQEKLSEGVCSTLSLSRIENGTAGVSPSTFQALMAHAGSACEAYPIFANRADFDCFYSLKRARFYLGCWQLKEACEELDSIEQKNFAENKYYYQEWLLLYSRLLFRSGCGVAVEIYEMLLNALHISRPSIDFSDFRSLLLSITEIELLIAIAQESLYLSNTEQCLEICMQISSYLQNCPFSLLEKELLLAQHAIVYSKYLIAKKEYSIALNLADTFRLKMIKNNDDTFLHELTFLTGLGYYYTGAVADALTCFKTAFFSAHSIGSSYATTIQHYLQDTLGISLFDSSFALPEIPLVSYAQKQAIDTSDFSDGTYDLFAPETLTLGRLIQELRLEQNLSQSMLCKGLCSTSKLSKIENNTLQPDIALAKSLLQRLGISDAVFTFYGNAHETALHELRQQMTLIYLSDTEMIKKHTEKMCQLCTKSDTFYLQYATYKNATCISDTSERAKALLQTLQTTLPGFTLNTIHNYRLSWLELTILNNYCNALRQHSPVEGTLAFYKLLEYYNSFSLDILEKKRVFTITLSFFSATLYKQERFSELIELSSYLSSPMLKGALYSLGIFLANYSQVLGNMKQFINIPLYATYAYYNLIITASVDSAIALKDSIYMDFHISLL